MQLRLPEKIKQNLLISLIIITHLAFSYYFFKDWWYSAIGTALIILISWFIWKKDFLKNIGLKIKISTTLTSVALAGIMLVLSYYISGYIAGQHNVQILFTNWRNYFHDIFYTLNEEIILGSLLLFFCIKKLKTHHLFISAAVAVIFSGIHFVFYKWIFLQSGIIEPLTLTTLFMVGFMRNNLIITFGHIAYSWAFHFGWMAVMFGSYHYYTISEKGLSEPERFNMYLGSYEMLIISILLAGVSVWLYLRKYNAQKY